MVSQALDHVFARLALGKRPVSELELVHARVSEKTVWSFVVLTSDDGLRGVGEASLPLDPASLDLPFVRARNTLVHSSLEETRAFTRVDRRRLPEAAIASAIEQATWDLCSRQTNASVVTVLGGDQSTSIPLYANINRRTTDRTRAGFAKSARDAVEAGYDAFKIAPFDDVTPQTADSNRGRHAIAEGVDRAAAVRKAIGPERELFVDCHWRFTASSAMRAIDALAELGVSWFECPLPEGDDAMAAIRTLRGHANARGMRLAGLEQLTCRAAFRPWLDAGIYDVVMPDVKYCGGVEALIAIGEDANRHGARCAPHNPSGPVSHAASLAACSALPAPVLLEHQWDETPWFYALAGEALPKPIAGASAMPKAAGFGVALSLDGLSVRRVS
ncbi:MAG TPA: mandelate racemase/muconate lactonizing enzyme family protein [Casimicrobiaceae bacterium]|nr:mandelate racemase/muconate lactonizing enzyme family protein [Casimicrobiaceae bacterium]